MWGVQINSLHLCSFVASLELATKGHFAHVHSSSKYYKEPKTYRNFTWFGFGFNKHYDLFNRLTPNDSYMGRTAPLTSKHCISYIYSTNIGTEYFKHALYSRVFLFKMQFVS